MQCAKAFCFAACFRPSKSFHFSAGVEKLQIFSIFLIPWCLDVLSLVVKNFLSLLRDFVLTNSYLSTLIFTFWLAIRHYLLCREGYKTFWNPRQAVDKITFNIWSTHLLNTSNLMTKTRHPWNILSILLDISYYVSKYFIFSVYSLSRCCYMSFINIGPSFVCINTNLVYLVFFPFNWLLFFCWDVCVFVRIRDMD